MKCMLPVPETTEEEVEKREKRNIRENDKVFNYVSRSIMISLHRNAGFGAERTARFNSGSYDIGRYYIERYTEEDDDPEDYAVTSYYALVRDLKAIGWNAKKELWTDDIFYTFVNTRGMSRSNREKVAAFVEYAKTISFYSRQMICMSAMGLHEDFGFGAEKFNRVFHPVRDKYLNLMQIFIQNRENRVPYEKELKAVLDEFNSIKFFKTETEV